MAVRTEVDEGGGAASPPVTPRAYEFGTYRLEQATRRLLRGGAPVPLTPKAFDTLLALIERRDRVVEKAELMQAVWPDSFVEDANLSQTIFVLRRTLGEAPDGRPFIDTVPRRGYRFAAAVREDDGKPAAVRGDSGQPAATPAGRPFRPLTTWRLAAAALLVIAMVAFGAVWMRSGADTSERVESLVVLPFEDLSYDEGPDALADSMTDALITKLGQVAGLRVISRTSSSTYRNTGKTVPQIARELNVDGVVEGTVHRAAGRVTLNLKLIHAPTDSTMWAQSYQGDPQHALDLHNEIARAIVSRTTVDLTARDNAVLAETTRVSAKVYEAYLKGRYFWNRRSEPDMRQAIAHFEEAIRLDSGYAPAYAGLADSYALYGSYGWPLGDGHAWTKAIAAADKALELDERLADGHTSRARIALNYELDWARTEAGYRRALELNPGYANVHHWYGYYLMLTGRLNDGQAEMRRALELDPLSPIINANIGMAFYFGRRYDAALAHWEKALEMHRNYRLLHVYMATAYLAKQMYPDAIAQLEKGLSLSGAGAWETALLAHAYGRTGRTKEAQALMSKVLPEGDQDAYSIALGYVGLGNTDKAFAWLNRAVDTRMGSFNEVNADPIFDPLRTDPRFAALLSRMRFPG